MSFRLTDKSEIQAFARLRHPDNYHLLELFKKELAEIDRSLRTATDTHLVRLQGKALLIEEILEAAEKAPSILERMK